MIDVKEISKTFKLYQKPGDRLKEILFKKKLHRTFCALKNVSFSVEDGKTVGIVGVNGSGKSTLLKILTGIYIQDSGTFSINGSITGLLELGTGFNSEFSGVENIYLNGTYIGMPRNEIDRKIDTIIEFSELESFIKEPIKTYSSGMIMRLAFSVAIHAEPNAFVVDEALGVGDAYFQQKCMTRLKQFKATGGSIIFVSHDVNAVKVLCDKALLLNDGEIIENGSTEHVLNIYNYLIAAKNKKSNVSVSSADNAFGNFKARIVRVDIFNENKEKTDLFISGSPAVIKILVQADKQINEKISLGIAVRDRFGQDIFGVNTFQMGQAFHLAPGESKEICFQFDHFNIGPGKYTLSTALHSGLTHIDDCYHWLDGVHSFEVVADSRYLFSGLIRLEPKLTFINEQNCP